MSRPVKSQGDEIAATNPPLVKGGRSIACLATAAIIILAMFQLRFQGRRWWCACGQLDLWSGDVWSSHNSQHLFDPYSFTHVLHGVVLYWVLSWLCPRLSH